MSLFPRCPDCGGMVVLTSKTGRTREVVKGVWVNVPDDFLIPTCTICGEESMVAEVSAELDPILRKDPLAQQALQRQALEWVLSEHTRDRRPNTHDVACHLGIGTEEARVLHDALVHQSKLAPGVIIEIWVPAGQ